MATTPRAKTTVEVWVPTSGYMVLGSFTLHCEALGVQWQALRCEILDLGQCIWKTCLASPGGIDGKLPKLFWWVPYYDYSQIIV